MESLESDDRMGQSLPSSDSISHAPHERSRISSQGLPQRRERRQYGSEAVQAQRLARRVGWFSIGLGVTEFVAPGMVGRITGTRASRGWIRLGGVREIVYGVGIVSRRKPIGWLRSRVLSDFLTFVTLGKAVASPDTARLRVAGTVAAVAGISLLDIHAVERLTAVAGEIEDDDDSILVTKSIQISRPAAEIYRFWRDFNNLPRVMAHLDSIEVIDAERSRWSARGPAGKQIEWEAELIEDRPDESIAWRSVEGSAVENSGSVKFTAAPGGGTLLHVELSYRPPAGRLGVIIAKLLGEEPALQLEEDLRRLKQLMETGEIVTTQGQSAGRTRSRSLKYDHAGRRLAAAF